MSSQNNNGCIKRIRYYKGQVLTARDFQDQQAYHLDKLRRHVKRFPFGVVEGLEVEFNVARDVFFIEPGLAVDNSGREIVVGTGGLEVPRTGFDPNKGYLSILYTEKDTCDEQSVCDSPRKYNRVCEKPVYQWDSTPDPTGNRITLAKVEETGDDDQYRFLTELDEEGRRIRLNARVIEEENVIFRGINGHDHSGDVNGTPIDTEGLVNGAVTEPKIAGGAVTGDKIQDSAVTGSKIAPNAVTSQKIDNNTVVRSLNNLQDAVKLSAGKNITIDIDTAQKELTINAVADGYSLDAPGNEGPKDVVNVDDEGVVRIQLAEKDSALLDVDGTVSMDRFIMENGAGEGKVLTSNATGEGTWQAPPGGVATITAGAGLEVGGTSRNVIMGIANGGVNSGQIAADAVKSIQIANEAVIGAKIASTNNAERIQTNNIADGAITGPKIASDTNARRIQTNNIADGAVTGTKIASDSNTNRIQTDNIADAAITNTKLSLRTREDLRPNSINGNETTVIAFEDGNEPGWQPDFNIPMTGYVIPLPGQPDSTLTWSMGIRRTSAGMAVVFEITNHGAEVIGFTMRLLVFE